MPRSEEHVTQSRIAAPDRRESILAAASEVFGERGYIGATTDLIARRAGISQPYVVRMFGSKEALIVEVLHRALSRLIATFREQIALSQSQGEGREQMEARIATAYAELVEDRGLLLSLMHAFSMGTDPVIGQHARQGFLDVYRLLRDEAGFDGAETTTFLAHGMLLNTLLALRLPEGYATDADARELLECAVPNKLEVILGVFDGADAGAGVAGAGGRG